MKNKMIVVTAAAALAFTLPGCMSSGLLVSTNSTEVELAQANYKLIATSVSGSASAEYLFGASIPAGMYAQVFALIPLQEDRALYRRAIEDLWKNFETKNGAVAGRSLALVNVRYDTEAINAFVYTKPTLTIVADVVEFTR